MATTDQPAPPETRRSQILQAAAELFSTSGARGTSIAGTAVERFMASGDGQGTGA